MGARPRTYGSEARSDSLGRERRRRDSNPRQRLTPCNALAGRRLQPLGHFSRAPRIPGARGEEFVSRAGAARRSPRACPAWRARRRTAPRGRSPRALRRRCAAPGRSPAIAPRPRAARPVEYVPESVPHSARWASGRSASISTRSPPRIPTTWARRRSSAPGSSGAPSWRASTATSTSRGITSWPLTRTGSVEAMPARHEGAQRQRVRRRQAEPPFDVANAAVCIRPGQGGRLGVDRVDAFHVALGQVVGPRSAARSHQLLAPVEEHRRRARELVDQRVGGVGGHVRLVRVVGPARDACVEHLDRLDRVELGDRRCRQHVGDAGCGAHRDRCREARSPERIVELVLLDRVVVEAAEIGVVGRDVEAGLHHGDVEAVRGGVDDRIGAGERIAQALRALARRAHLDVRVGRRRPRARARRRDRRGSRARRPRWLRRRRS